MSSRRCVRAAFQQQQRRHLRAGLPLPHRLPAQPGLGTSAGTQNFASVESRRRHAPLIGPTHRCPPGLRLPDEASRLREGARIIVADPRRIDLVRTRTSRSPTTCPVRPEPMSPFVNAMAPSSSPRDSTTRPSSASCEDVAPHLEFIVGPRPTRRRRSGRDRRRPRADPTAARLYDRGPNAAIYYGLRCHRTQPEARRWSGMANLAMLTGDGPKVSVNPLRGQNSVQGSCDMGLFSHEFPGYRHGTAGGDGRSMSRCGPDPATNRRRVCGIPNMFDAPSGPSLGLYVQARTSPSPIPTPGTSRLRLRLDGPRRRPGPLQSRPRGSRTSSCWDQLPREGMAPSSTPSAGSTGSLIGDRWSAATSGRSSLRHRDDGPHVVCRSRRDHGRDRRDGHPLSPRRFRSRASTPRDRCSGRSANAARTGRRRARRAFVRRLGRLTPTIMSTTRQANRRFPLVSTGRILSAVQRRRPDPSHRELHLAPGRPPGIHPSDAELRGIRDGDVVELASRVGATRLTTQPSVPGCNPVWSAPPSTTGDRRQRGHDRELRLGDQLPRSTR